MSFGFGFGFPKRNYVSGAFDPAVLWPLGAASPGMWIDPPYLPSEFWESTGVTPVVQPGTVADSANPVGLIQDRKGGLALGAELVTLPITGAFTGGWAAAGDTVVRDGVTAGGVATVNITAHNGAATCLLEFDVAGLSGDTFSVITPSGAVGEISSNGHKTFRVATISIVELRFIPWGGGAGSLVISNISVREIPGINLSQATSAARPVASARVNLLTKTEDFADAAWAKTGLKTFGSGSVANTTATLDPLGGNNADFICEDTSTGSHYVQQSATNVSGIPFRWEVPVKAAGRDWVQIITATAGIVRVWANLTTGAVGTVAGSATDVTITPAANGWWVVGFTAVSSNTNLEVYISTATADNVQTFTGDGVSGLYLFGPQINPGSTALPYQAVVSDSDYDASAGYIYAKFDGTDDSWASATFAAGTLTSSMDCLIAVRRDSAADVVAGLYQTPGATPYAGYAKSGATGFCNFGVGSPTTWVDGVQLTGGTEVTPGTLHTALTVGDFHILEFRGLDLSAWTALAFGGYTAYTVNGGNGGIQLFASGQDANRTKARAAMAAYFGVTLA